MVYFSPSTLIFVSELDKWPVELLPEPYPTASAVSPSPSSSSATTHEVKTEGSESLKRKREEPPEEGETVGESDFPTSKRPKNE